MVTAGQISLAGSGFTWYFEQHNWSDDRDIAEGFAKIWMYGYLVNCNRYQRINEVLKSMQLPLHKKLVKVPLELRLKEQYGIEESECPVCKSRTPRLVVVYNPWKKGDDG